ncbi:MAG: hypothetical protein IPI59_12945 [Sphingobacteriales bacterium]|jgi:hypothetical protein|nr:hypothetical protein [Sphingobacteriales bacterium]MBP9140636.1 hypothetical protein [Chitinophagales bacterium]MDA0198943.1 hypothetical protein [Bacteroidota bacterium]MBK7528429.1 hypothetical protein [Sphingobacteriales bacterium]MBK8679609.1 hypothetical protein [Sphingobacteriales bacterium]
MLKNYTFTFLLASFFSGFLFLQAQNNPNDMAVRLIVTEKYQNTEKRIDTVLLSSALIPNFLEKLGYNETDILNAKGYQTGRQITIEAITLNNILPQPTETQALTTTASPATKSINQTETSSTTVTSTQEQAFIAPMHTTLDVSLTDLDYFDKQLLSKRFVNVSGLNLESFSSFDWYGNYQKNRQELAFNTPTSGNAFLFILSSSGKNIYTEELSNFKGNYLQIIPPFDLNKRGLYYVILIQDQNWFAKKIMLI